MEEAKSIAEQVADILAHGKKNLRDRDLRGADFRSAELDYVDFREADLTGADFSNAKLRYVSLEGAKLVSAKFMGGNLSGVSFEEADLKGSTFSRAHVLGASFHSADMQGADLFSFFGRGGLSFTDADMTGADLRYSRFDGADFEHADLSGTDMRFASFCGAIFSRAVFTDAKINWRDHDLVAALLLNSIDESCFLNNSASQQREQVQRRALAGLVLANKDWCWSEFVAAAKYLPKTAVAWALGILETHNTPNSPEFHDVGRCLSEIRRINDEK